jgi:membrane dipeptidase
VRDIRGEHGYCHGAQIAAFNASIVATGTTDAFKGLLASLRESPDNIYDAGYRLVAPTHFFDTFVSGSAHGLEKDGLTDQGRRWVREMDRLSMIIDLAHASPQTMDDILQLTTRPVLVSHTGVQGTCPGVRNLGDDYLRRIAEGGGLIGIGFWKAAVCGETVKDIVQAIAHAVEVAGVEHVALGSDFDGAVAVPFDVSAMAQLTDGLLKGGFSPGEIRRIAGENVADFLLKNLPETQ